MVTLFITVFTVFFLSGIMKLMSAVFRMSFYLLIQLARLAFYTMSVVCGLTTLAMQRKQARINAAIHNSLNEGRQY